MAVRKLGRVIGTSTVVCKRCISFFRGRGDHLPFVPPAIPALPARMKKGGTVSIRGLCSNTDRGKRCPRLCQAAGRSSVLERSVLRVSACSSGFYSIAVPGSRHGEGGYGPLRLYCDMVTDGGGWATAVTFCRLPPPGCVHCAQRVPPPSPGSRRPALPRTGHCLPRARLRMGSPRRARLGHGLGRLAVAAAVAAALGVPKAA